MAAKSTNTIKKPKKEIKISIRQGSDEFKRAADYKTLYVNTTQFGFTRWDFQIMFGTVASTRDPEHAHGTEVATVIMTPKYAKALLLDYMRVINEFETKHGAIEIGIDSVNEILKEQKAVKTLKK